jgi:S1-C subfamily serine protease
VVITETWKGYRADQAGLLPGDLIVSLEDQPVHSVDNLEVLILPPSREIFELGIVRGAKTMQTRLRVRPGLEEEAEPIQAGLKLSAPAEGYLIDSVTPGSPAANAGIQPGDRLLEINHEEPRSLPAVQQALSQGRAGPLHVVLERGERRWDVILE